MHKKGPKDDIGNYRPISLTSLVIKTLTYDVGRDVVFLSLHRSVLALSRSVLPSNRAARARNGYTGLARRRRSMKTLIRIIKVELLYETSHLLDDRQHGFLSQKSCTSNILLFSDSVVLSINDCNTMSTDVIYFDFSKAFDLVNHDLILYKLKPFMI